MWLLVVACSAPTTPDDPVPTETTTSETGGGTTDRSTAETATGSTADTAPPPPPPPPPDLCYPEIGVPGQIEGAAVDPHAEVYGAEPAPTLVRLGWPGTDPSVSASFLWQTDIATLASRVELTPVGGSTLVLDGASFLYGSDGAQRVHEVKVCRGLSPATTYDYRVGGPGGWSEVHRFTTPAPPDQLDHVRVAFAGDSRGSYTQWALVVQAASAWSPDVFVFTGDAVNVGTSQAEWNAWLRAGETLFDHVPLLVAHGNHEGQSIHWFAQMSYPADELAWPMRYGPLQLLFLNDTTTPEDLDVQAALIDEVFARSDAPWKVAVHHQSPYATCDRHRSNLKIRDRWTPRYEADGVDLVLAGHNHIYERSLPILGGKPSDPGTGVTYVVAGGAGAPLYTTFTADWFSSVAVPKKHFGIADFGPGGVDVTVHDPQGNVIDAFTLPLD